MSAYNKARQAASLGVNPAVCRLCWRRYVSMQACVRLLTVACVAAATSACSTAPYLKPLSEGGTYNTKYASCPGALEVIELQPTPEDWITLRVLAEHRLDGTSLTVHFTFNYWKPEPPRERWTPLYSSPEEKAERNALIKRRESEEIVISSPDALATIVLADGSSFKVLLPFFEAPYNPNDPNRAYERGGQGPEVLISSKPLDNFEVFFPDVLFNGSPLEIPVIKFQTSTNKYLPVFNC